MYLVEEKEGKMFSEIDSAMEDKIFEAMDTKDDAKQQYYINQLGAMLDEQ
jgi:hypothetical protein